MFCSKCGNELREDDVFCSKCGEKVVKEQQNNIDKMNTSNTNIDLIIENKDEDYSQKNEPNGNNDKYIKLSKILMKSINTTDINEAIELSSAFYKKQGIEIDKINFSSQNPYVILSEITMFALGVDDIDEATIQTINFYKKQETEDDAVTEGNENIDEEKPTTEKEYKIKIEDRELTKEIMQKFFEKYNFEKRTSMAELRVGAKPDDGQSYVRTEIMRGCHFFFKFEGNCLIIKLDNKGAEIAYPLHEKNIRLVDNLVIDIKTANGYDVNELPEKHDVSDIKESGKNKTGFFSRIFGKK